MQNAWVLNQKILINPELYRPCYVKPNKGNSSCYIWATTWDFQQCGMCDQQSLRSAWAYVQTDQGLC